ncbi:hypothetical protein TVAG_119420 [Trichomonas vaginalis G3]|uniref:PH domain-containing protein n=1 Tax=Trichomonas vaginalis (strain ATCC PRA-98 / G3) TaxID=412133 RepID=A2D789_TRIV3|nr:mRNA-decapping enzyme C-terminus [Trichomonas vaginalis G3]EAY23606.1 hypothetical protein TVAG_119420 [Trichomonas vaginalis G3]KAI5490099.1 mRNA-decapping enzyme C-terminus [Trichomonas vaginalis G3]|eukprot:XP_001276854.1 hypothetical protein [Trichomonas vaginalis G3]
MSITLGAFPTKKEMNLNAIKRIYSELVYDYAQTYSDCTIFTFDNTTKQWKKLQISGALFILCLEGNTNPVILILNRCSYIDPEDFTLELPPTTQISCKNNQVYIKIDQNHHYCISTVTEENSKDFVDNIHAFWMKNKNTEYMRDPTFRHILKQSIPRKL